MRNGAILPVSFVEALSGGTHGGVSSYYRKRCVEIILFIRLPFSSLATLIDCDNSYIQPEDFVRIRSVVLFLFLLPALLSAHTFYVTNTKDDGSEGSFRWAVEMCNWYPLIPDTVLFAIPLDDPGYNPEFGFWTIRCDTNLTGTHTRYKISQPGAYIDAFSQREFIGYDTNPLGPEIELIGPLSGMCFDIEKNDVTIRGFCIHNYDISLFHIMPWPPNEITTIENIRISGCYYNIDPTGTIPKRTSRYGLDIDSGSTILIGGNDINNRNIFGPVRTSAIKLYCCDNVEIKNNFIGVDRTGTIETAGSEAEYAINNWGPVGPTTISENLICGDFRVGIFIQFSDGEEAVTTVVDNILGEGLDGTIMPLDDAGIEVYHSPGQVIRENTVAHVTGWHGIRVTGDNSDYVSISRNSVYDIHRLGIENEVWQCTGSGVDLIDGQYGPGANEEIDPCYCDSVVSYSTNETSSTIAYFTCMADCMVEIFIGDPGDRPSCPLPEYGNVFSGRTYLGDAEEIIQGPVFSQYRFSISPALPEGTILTTTATNQNGSTSEFGCSCTIPLIDETESGCLPSDFKFLPPAPNPSDGSVTVCYHVPETAHVSVAIYDMGGRQIAVITDAVLPPRVYGVKWNGRDRRKMQVPTGTYIVRMVSEKFIQSHTLNIVR